MPQIAAAEVVDQEAETRLIELHRFGLPDLEPMGLWLYERLHTEFPSIAQNYLASWLRGIMENGEYLFLCAPKAAGLFQRLQRRLHTDPYVEEVFNLTVDDSGIDEAQEIYRAAKRWAAGMNATEMIVGGCTDLTQKEVVAALGPVKLKNHWTVKVR